ncbi:PepSY domain-containing protein [Carnobacterium pleistocenium]|uniref:PepSY domain-containing protein n=1 Tax=Carnobacterium pleistocenium TaxID=181073 RepID=UPI00054E6770|nr:PepSY domain-containing protein [Carnobacterium pleistocenium]
MLSTVKIGLVSGSALILLAACGSTEAPTNNSTSSTTTGTDSSSSVSENFEGKSFSVTYEQAIADFQEAYPTAVISSIDFDKDFGEYTFEISGFDDTQEIEWEINAENGEETKNKTEMKDSDNDEQELMVDALMTIDELITKSEEEAPNAVLTSWNLEADEDTNTPLFTGEFKEGMNEVDVHLNAETGELLSVEND